MLINTLSDKIFVDVIATLFCITAHRYWVHSKQVCVSGYEPCWNDQMMPILMNTLPDMICIDVIATLCCIAAHRYRPHRNKVWGSGYKPYWNDYMTPILINTLSDMICIDVIATLLHCRSLVLGPREAGMSFRTYIVLKWSNDAYTYEYTIIYDLHRCNRNLCCIAT